MLVLGHHSTSGCHLSSAPLHSSITLQKPLVYFLSLPRTGKLGSVNFKATCHRTHSKACLCVSCCQEEQAVKICMSMSTYVCQPHFLRRPQRWWLPLHRSSSWHSDHRAYQGSCLKSFKVTRVGGTDYQTLSYYIRSTPPMFQTASFCLVPQCPSLRPPHPVTQKTCQSHYSHGRQFAKCANGIPSSTPITTDPSRVQLNRLE